MIVKGAFIVVFFRFCTVMGKNLQLLTFKKLLLSHLAKIVFLFIIHGVNHQCSNEFKFKFKGPIKSGAGWATLTAQLLMVLSRSTTITISYWYLVLLHLDQFNQPHLT